MGESSREDNLDQQELPESSSQLTKDLFRERELQRQAIIGVFTDRDDDELLHQWEDLRRGIEDQLADPPAEAVELVDKEISRLSRRLDSIEQGELNGSGEAISQAERRQQMCIEALLVSERLRWIRRLVGCYLQANPPFNPASLIRSEIIWIRQRARDLQESWELKGDPSLSILVQDTFKVRDQLQMVSLEGFLKRNEDTHIEEQNWRVRNEEDSKHISSSLKNFISHWERVEDYHEILSAFDETAPNFKENVEKLRVQHEEYLQEVKDILLSAEGRDRGELLIYSVKGIEDLISGFISEGDLLEIPDRILKLKQVIVAVDEYIELIRSCEGKKRHWFRSITNRLHFDKAYRRIKWLRYYSIKSVRSLQVEARLEDRFGRAHLHRVENLVFFLIFCLLGLVGLEWYMEESVWKVSPWNAHADNAPQFGSYYLLHEAPWAFYFQIADLLICTGLLADFFLRWAFARWKFWFFRQHFFFDFLPALPYGFIAGQMAIFHSTEYVHLALIIRVIGYQLRSAGPFLRLLRLMIFMVRGLDRIVSRFRGFLDRHILLFEAEDETSFHTDPLVKRAEKESIRGVILVRELLNDMTPAVRSNFIIQYLKVIRLEVLRLQPRDFAFVDPRPSTQDVELEEVVDKLVECDVLLIEKIIGQDGARQVSRFMRWLDLPLLRRLPLIQGIAVASRGAQPVENVAQAARELGQFLERLLSVFKVWGDLSGITTGPQILDRVSTAMIKATQRPAVRLLLFGGLFLCLTLVFEFFIEQAASAPSPTGADGSETIGSAHWFEDAVILPIQRILGWPLLVLGSACLIVNFLGRWFKRIAGEALDVYLRTAEAHFFPLIKEVKAERLELDLRKIYQRVLIPECRIREFSDPASHLAFERIREKLGPEAMPADRVIARELEAEDQLDDLEYELTQVSLLYRDFLDSSLFDRNDDQSSIQILGNMSIRDIRQDVLGQGKRDLRRLERLALRKERILGTGPYLWFRFISESIAIETAKLIIEYNSSCLPLRRLPMSSKEASDRFEAFLEMKRAELDPAARRVLRSKTSLAELNMLTTEFNSLHFLHPDPFRDERIEERFGEEVAKAMVRDRRAMVRDIFGTWPYHLLPKNVRRINLYRIYFKYLRGARIFLLPFVILLRLGGLFLLGLGSLRRVVDEVLGKGTAESGRLTQVANFEVAKRKINRMRKSYFMEAMRLRAAVDVEYLGLRIPGVEPDPGASTYLDDLRFIGALERERRFYERHRRRFLRDLRLLRQFFAEKGWLSTGYEKFKERLIQEDPSLEKMLNTVKSGPVMRAIVTAFITDRFELRSHIVGHQEAQKYLNGVLSEKSWGTVSGTLLSFYGKFKTLAFPKARRRKRIFDKFWASSENLTQAKPQMKDKALFSFLNASSELERYFRLATEHSPQEREQAIVKILRSIVSEQSLWSRKLLTLRMIQTVTILDIAVYRDLIHELGGFEEPRGDF